MREEYGHQVRIVYRDFSQSGSDSLAFDAALAAECAAEQGRYETMRELLFENQPRFDNGRLQQYALSLELNMEEFKQCLQSEAQQIEVLADHADTVKYGINSTPTFFINEFLLVGDVPFSEFERLIEMILAGQ